MSSKDGVVIVEDNSVIGTKSIVVQNETVNVHNKIFIRLFV